MQDQKIEVQFKTDINERNGLDQLYAKVWKSRIQTENLNINEADEGALPIQADQVGKWDFNRIAVSTNRTCVGLSFKSNLKYVPGLESEVMILKERNLCSSCKHQQKA